MSDTYNFGDKTDLVTEVLDFITSGNFLNMSESKDANDTLVLTDFQTAKDYAFNKYYGDEEYTWSDICADESSKVWGEIFKHSDTENLQNVFSVILHNIDNSIKNQIKSPYDELRDDLVDDLSNCINSRAVQGTKNKFYEQIFSAYKSGGWPCGWDGDWPNGRLVVYYPPKK